MTKTRWVSAQTSLKYKVLICRFFLVSVSLYLPIGPCLVSNWYNYAEDMLVHTMRVVTQHISVALLILFFVCLPLLTPPSPPTHTHHAHTATPDA